MKRNVICMIFFGFLFSANAEIREFFNLDTTINETWEWRRNDEGYSKYVTNTVCTLSSQQTFSIINFSRIHHGDPDWDIVATDGYRYSGSGYSNGLYGNDIKRISPVTSFKLIYQNNEYDSMSSDSSDIFHGPGEVISITEFQRKISIGINSNYGYPVFTYVDLRLDVENYLSRLSYQIVTSDSVDSDKFSVSLDNDGDRVAVGYKSDGSNAVVRVYEFDGSDWQQLGSDID